MPEQGQGGRLAGGSVRPNDPISNYQDIDQVCIDCADGFVVSAGEVRFFKQRNLNIPKRCLPCRQKRRALAGK